MQITIGMFDMKRYENLCHFYSGGVPDWPRCVICTDGGKMGNEISSLISIANDEFAPETNCGPGKAGPFLY